MERPRDFINDRVLVGMPECSNIFRELVSEALRQRDLALVEAVRQQCEQAAYMSTTPGDEEAASAVRALTTDALLEAAYGYSDSVD